MKQDGTARTGSHLDPLALQTFVDHEASPADSLRYARHLSDCARCDTTRRRLESLSDDLSSLPGAEVPEGFSQRIMQRVATMPAPRRRTRLLRLVAPTAAAVFVALIALANPWTVRLARGVGHRLPEAPLGPSELMDLLFAMGATILAGLARAASNLGPWFTGPAVGTGSGFQIPGTLLLLGLLAVVGVVGLALAGSGLWFLRARKTVE
jgi:hypothetical protein